MSNCPICGSETKLVPAGIAKASGKPYGAFWACSDRNCKWTQKLAPGQPTPAVNAMSNIARQTQNEKDTETAEGKVRHGVSCEYIRNKAPLNQGTANEIKAWTDFIMTGEFDPNNPINIPF